MVHSDSNTAALLDHMDQQDKDQADLDNLIDNKRHHIEALWGDYKIRVDMLMHTDFEKEQIAALTILLIFADRLPFPFNTLIKNLRNSFDDAAESYIIDNPEKFLPR